MTLAREFLRTKQILIIITSLLFVSGTIWFGSHHDVRPAIPEKHRVIMVPTVPTKPFPDNSKLVRIFDLVDEDKHDKKDTMEATSMQSLLEGEGWEIVLPKWANTSFPALVTAMFETEDFLRILKLIYSVQEHSNETHLVIFDMTEKKKQPVGEFNNRESVETYCNLTHVCSVHDDDPFLSVASYMRKKTIGAYKPILIQKILKLFPMVMWLDSDVLIPAGSLSAVWNRTQKQNITTWELVNRCAASSYTFKKMLPYFGLQLDDLHFNPMIESGSYAFKRTPTVDVLIKLWLNCSFTEGCIKPIGCDNRDCPHLECKNLQPRFDYMGCHLYETSALSASLIKLNYHEYHAPHKDYPFSDFESYNSMTLGYNATYVKYMISRERNRNIKFGRRRKVNTLQ